jgi:hypothetical protein
MAPPPLRYAVQGFAALRRQESKWAGEKEPQEGIGKSAGEWHFTLRESQASTRMSFPPRNAYHHEWLISVHPAIASTVGEERRGWGVESPSRDFQVWPWFSMPVVALSPPKHFLPE